MKVRNRITIGPFTLKKGTYHVIGFSVPRVSDVERPKASLFYRLHRRIRSGLDDLAKASAGIVPEPDRFRSIFFRRSPGRRLDLVLGGQALGPNGLGIRRQYRRQGDQRHRVELDLIRPVRPATVAAR